MHIQWRDEKNKDAGYFLLNEDGSEIHQAHAKPEQWERARKRKVSIDAIILEDAAEKLGKEATPAKSREVKIVRVEAEPHFHDDRYLLALPEHSHDEYVQDLAHEHPQIDELTRDARAHEMANLEAFRLTDKALREHKHDGLAPLAHEHEALTVSVGGLVARVAGMEEHVHTEAPWHEHREIEAQLTSLRNDVLDLNQRLAFLSTELRAAMVTLGQDIKAELAKQANAVHGHDEYATTEALAQHIEQATRKASLVVLSQEETGGRRRLIVEETR